MKGNKKKQKPLNSSKKWALVLPIKYPQPGSVKPKLAKTLGPQKAGEIYRALTERSIEASRPLHGEYEPILFYDPRWTESTYREWLGKEAALSPQKGKNLAERLQNAIGSLLKKYERVIVMDPDKPSLSTAHLQEAFEALDRSEVVLGPTQEGGFYLIGFKKFYPEIFEKVLWSTPCVFDTLFKVLTGMDVDPHLLPVLSEE